MDQETAQAFEAGFLLRCAEEGLNYEATAKRVKMASLVMKKAFFDSAGIRQAVGNMDWQKNPGSTAASLGSLVIGVPAVAGAVGGHLAHWMQGDGADADDVKKQELANQMRLLAQQARAEQARRLMRPHQR